MTSPVLIVGAGPVGMTLASELTRYGVAVRIVDTAKARTDKSKAIVLWSRTLELLDRGGVAGSKPFVDAGLKVDGVTFMVGDKTVGRVAMNGIPSAHNYALTIPQSETERLLEERLSEQGVTLERETVATAIQPDNEGVDVTLRRADGCEQTVRTPWLIGCDGAHSVVRRSLDMPFTGETLLSDWFLADVLMEGYPSGVNEASIYWHDQGILIFFPIQPGHFRIIGDLPYTTGSAPPPPTLEQVQAIIDRRGPSGIRIFDPIWLSGFRINGRKVESYRHGRVFVAGDAAHIHSPAAGQGMNTGMQDAFNLAWKLALVVHGTCADSLLDSYSLERSAVGTEVLKAAARLTTVGTLKNPVARTMRNLAAQAILGIPAASHAMANMMSEVKVRYADSPLNGPFVRGGLHTGERVRQTGDGAPVGSGKAPRFALFADNVAALAELLPAFGDLVNPDVRPALQNGVLSLVRPDGYLACSTHEVTTIQAYLCQFRRTSTRRPF